MPLRAPACLVALGLVASALVTPTAHAAPPPSHVPPVDAPVVDPFRPPPHRYAAGNRGLEYGTEPGAPVHVTGDGTVTFAGQVAGAQHVTVLHADGVRTSYSFVADVSVVVGQRVRQGERIATTSGHLHLGARRGDAYFDPATLFGAAAADVWLVPFDEPPGGGAAGERSAIGQLIGGVGGALGGLAAEAVDGALGGSGATVAWLRREGPQVLRAARHYLERGVPGPSQLRLLLSGLDAWRRANAAASRPCTPIGAGPEPRPGPARAAILVGGLGSTSAAAAVDEVATHALGYAVPDVVRFSYAGGRTPDPTDAFPGIDAAPYDAAATQVDLHEPGRRLADLIEEVTAARPGAPVDVYAHSQGGLVARLALRELERRHGTAWVERLGLVATLGTPHGGADLATAVHAIGSSGGGSAAFDALATGLGLTLDDDAASVAQLAETSDLVAELRDAPIPSGVDAVSIAAREDVIVPVPRTAVDGAEQVVVSVGGLRAHDALPGSPAATRELALALAGQPPTCTSFRSALLDQLSGQAISWGEDALGGMGWAAALRFGRVPLGG